MGVDASSLRLYQSHADGRSARKVADGPAGVCDPAPLAGDHGNQSPLPGTGESAMGARRGAGAADVPDRGGGRKVSAHGESRDHWKPCGEWRVEIALAAAQG